MINVGLVGCGRVSAKHFKAIEAVDGMQIWGVCDIDPGAFKNTHDSWIYQDYSSMLEDEVVDMISICTPSDLHAEMVIQAANAGKHVLVEKPLALNVFDASCAIQACRENNVKLCVVVQNRFNEPMVQFKKLLDSGKLGKVLVANATCRWNRPLDYFSGWHGSWKRSGGVIINQLIHPIDALLWLVGDIMSVSAYCGNQCHDLPFPDTYVANLEFKNGAMGSFEGTVCAYPQNAENSLTFVCEKGVVKIGGVSLDHFSYIVTPSFRKGYRHRLEKVDIYGEGHIPLYREMFNAIEEDRDPTIDGIAGLNALNVALAIHDSAIRGCEVFLER